MSNPEEPRRFERRPTSDCGIAADRALVKRLVEGDNAAAHELFMVRHGAVLSHLASKYGGEERIGELFIHLAKDDWRNLRSWRGESSLGTWLYLVASRLFRRSAKASQALPSFQDWDAPASSSDEPSMQVMRRETAAQVLHAVEKIPNAKQRMAVRLNYLLGVPPAKAAASLRVSTSYYFVLLHRGLVWLRAYFDGRDRDV